MAEYARQFELDPEQLSNPGSVPLPSGDFEPFFAEYSQYDAALESSLNTIHDLGISNGLSLPLPGSIESMSGTISGSMSGPGMMMPMPGQSYIRPYLKPPELANLDLIPEEDDTLALGPELSSSPQKPHMDNSDFGALSPPHVGRSSMYPPSSPPTSPVRPVGRHHTRVDSLGISGAALPRPVPLIFPSTTSERQSSNVASAGPSELSVPSQKSGPMTPLTPMTPMTPGMAPPVPQPNFQSLMAPQPPSSPYASSPYASPSHVGSASLYSSPMRPQPAAGYSPGRYSPGTRQNRLAGHQNDHYHQNESDGYDEESDYLPQSATPSPDLPEHGQGDLDDDAFKWQPILTVPRDQSASSEKIIASQRSRKKQRKSCLPPGTVDEYVQESGDGTYTCLYPHCGRLFRRRYNLRSHIQTHLSDRPYACAECSASFVRPHDLRRHQRVHSTQKEYLCPCGKGFNRQDALTRHRHRQICEGGIAPPSGSRTEGPKRRGRPPIKTNDEDEHDDYYDGDHEST